MNIPPYDALPGFSLSTGMREIAAYYGIRVRSLKRKDARHGLHVTEARDALFYKMTEKHGWSAERVAQALHCSPRTVKDGADRHRAAIALFRDTHAIKETS
jgi:ParB-like chromosome segregation protein Spo0J